MKSLGSFLLFTFAFGGFLPLNAPFFDDVSRSLVSKALDGIVFRNFSGSVCYNGHFLRAGFFAILDGD